MNPTGMLAAAARNYIQSKQQSSPEGTSSSEATLEGDLFKKPKRMSELRRDWMDYNGWLKKQQLPELDKNGKPVIDPGTGKPKMKSAFGDDRLDTDLGMKLFKQYQNEHPETTLSEEYFPIIRSEIIHLADRQTRNLKEGRMTLGKQYDAFARHGDPELINNQHLWRNEASDKPNYPGKYLTRYDYQPTVEATYLNSQLQKQDKYDYNQNKPDFSLDEYNSATDKNAFLDNLYNNFEKGKSWLGIPGSTGQAEMNRYKTWRTVQEIADDQRKKRISEKNNKTLNQ